MLTLQAPEDIDRHITLDVATGQPVVIDALGPVVVNSDGTLSRITNWERMEESERNVAKRRISKRNVERLRAFRDKGELKQSLVSALAAASSDGAASGDAGGGGAEGRNASGFRFSIDRGGTFTDVYALCPGEAVPRCVKLLSVDPANYPDAPREGIRRVLEAATGVPHPRGERLNSSRIEWIRMGTTVATNALLERDGARTALLVSKGFADVLHIGSQARPDIFDLRVRCPGVLYEAVVEVDERVVLAKSEPPGEESAARRGLRRVRGETGEQVLIEREPDLDALRGKLAALRASGVEAVAVVLMHAYTYRQHEEAVAALAREVGFAQVTTSSSTLPMVKLVPRGYTATADAYLTPHIKAYLASFVAGFDDDISKVEISFMQSDGGLAPADSFCGFRAVLSGPAGGYIGYAKTAHTPGGPPVIGFDMGGTSTDVSRYAGSVEQVFEARLAGVTIQAPQLDIKTVAAGGGSRFFFREGRLAVGPQSVRAHPGPVCYRKGGQLATTDANLLLGRIRPEHFPRIFGPDEDQPLDVEGTRAAFEAMLSGEVHPFYEATSPAGAPPRRMSVEQLAHGFLEVANEAMCRPIREMTQMRGHDAAAHVLASFGGAGGQHACAVARSLGMTRVYVHRHASILSAVGIALADVVVEKQEAAALTLGEPGAAERVSVRHAALAAAVEEQLAAQGFAPPLLRTDRFLNLRYAGTDTAIMVSEPAAGGGAYAAAFEAQHRREFGFTFAERPVLIDDIRVRGTGLSPPAPAAPTAAASGALPPPTSVGRTYFESGWEETPSYSLQSLAPGNVLEGPALLLDDISTVVVEPNCTATVTATGHLEILVRPRKGARGETRTGPEAQRGAEAAPAEGAPSPSGDADPVQLSLYSHRFMGIAEQMGRTLQRTSVSTNIKERLDFSCALFDASGGLVANAPHIPVHLGAMQDAVQLQQRRWEGDINAGDVFLSNCPHTAGGSHLPDLTVITPAFLPGDGEAPAFWVASRGHHADIGGATPGSMPPFSHSLSEEGARIVGFRLVSRGVLQEEGVRSILAKSRNLADNLSDLKAQVAANEMGLRLLASLAAESSLAAVRSYMHHIQANAEATVRAMLRAFAARAGLGANGVCTAADQLDDGSEIRLAVTIDAAAGSATFDFSGTSPQSYSNLNAPRAVTYSAVIYSLRALCDTDMPLNQGCLAPVTFVLPEGCLLNPGETAAVVGGNVLTSQRVVDVVLKAFGACAASQGCMNNLTFGDETYGYYETIAGGAGAGPDWDGRSGVHTHMTNTRITDPEVLERRYPVVLRTFSLRAHSGGGGAHRGGDGVVREIEFLRPTDVSILSERRAVPPYGLAGGEPGVRGQNLLLPAGGGAGPTVSLGGKAFVRVEAGARLRVLSPGGGGYGAPAEAYSGGSRAK